MMLIHKGKYALFFGVAALGVTLGGAVLLAAGNLKPQAASITEAASLSQQTPEASTSLTLEQARVVAQTSLRDGNPKLSYALTKGLLQANPKDGYSHYLQALALADLKKYKQARRSARKAYQHSQTDEQQYQSAQLAAKLSFADERLTLSQLWLRRAVEYAPSEATRDEMIGNFRRVRSRNPLRFSFQLSVTPSDNVNNGSNSAKNIINGDSPTLSGLSSELSRSAQAISGIDTRLNLRGSYRLHQSKSQETRLNAQLSIRRVQFTESVDEDNPLIEELEEEDLSSTQTRVGISHLFGADSKGNSWQVNGDVGRVWFAQDPLFNFVEGGVQRRQYLTDATYLSIGTAVEYQQDLTAPRDDSTIYSGFGAINHAFDDGSRLALTLRYRKSESNNANRDSDRWTGTVRYALGRKIGPAKLNFSVGYSVLTGDFLTAGIATNRRDKTTLGSITATMQDWSYLGFVPTVSLNTRRTRSNVSRFDLDQTSVSIGIKSEF